MLAAIPACALPSLEFPRGCVRPWCLSVPHTRSRRVAARFSRPPQISAGLPWVSSLPLVRENGSIDTVVALYMMSYILVVNWIFMQVRNTRALLSQCTLVALHFVCAGREGATFEAV